MATFCNNRKKNIKKGTKNHRTVSFRNSFNELVLFFVKKKGMNRIKAKKMAKARLIV